MSATQKQIHANRLNAQKSTGPKTKEGKGQSRRNALRHGLTGKGVVIPDDMKAKVDRRINMFATKFEPDDDYQEWLVERAALASVRVDCCVKVDESRLAERRRHAFTDWDKARDIQVAQWAEALDERPAEALRELKGMAEGCDWLHDQWDDLREVLDEAGTWDERQAEHALKMLGGSSSVLLSSYQRQFRDQAQAARCGPDADEARAWLKEFAEAEMARLTTLGDELWERQDAPDRADAPHLALFDFSAEGRRLHQYEAAAERTLNRALGELVKLRKQDDDDIPAYRPRPRPVVKNEANPAVATGAQPGVAGPSACVPSRG